MPRAALLTLALAPACAAPPLEEAPADLALRTQARAETRSPGSPHAVLSTLAGDWAVTVEAPGGETPVGTGSARLEVLHGGLFLRLAVDLDLSGQRVALTGHLAFDSAADEWQALWLSDLSTGLSLLRGRGEPGRGVHLRGEQAGVVGRSVWRVESPDAFRFETYGAGADGKERLLRTSTYVRR